MRLRFHTFLIASFLLLSNALLTGQVHLDGPIIVKARLRNFNMTIPENDQGQFGASGAPDEMTYHIWGRDLPDVDLVSINSGWGNGSGCLIESYSYFPSATDYDTVFFSQVYPTAQTPHLIELRTAFWEDESADFISGINCVGTRCAFETGFCCGGIVFGVCAGLIDDDDLPCISNDNPGNAPYDSLDFRLGLPGQWYSHGNVSGNCANNIYFPRIETYWEYTNGNSCTNAIDLGTLNPGFSAISHINTVDGYTDNIPYAGGGKDVVYEFTILQGMWLDINTCGAGTCPTDLVLLDAFCSIIQANSGACGSGSAISRAFCTPGQYFIAVEARNNTPNGSFTLSIAENPGSMVSITPSVDTSACLGDSIVIGPSALPAGGLPPYTYTWQPITGLSNATLLNPSAAPSSTQQFILTVTDANGCSRTDTMQFNILSGPSFTLGPDTTVCPLAPITLSGPLGASAYLWSTGAITSSISTATPATYSLTVTGASCQSADTVLVSLGTALTPWLGPDTSFCSDTSVTIGAFPSIGNYLWSTGDTNPAIAINSPGIYSLTFTDLTGCIASDTIAVSQNIDCVFPGDVDHDGDCDLTDVLHIAALLSSSGLTRPGGNTNWYGQPSPDWASTYLGINVKHADTDGDGTVLALDTLAVDLNFGRTHTRIGTVASSNLVLRIEAQTQAVLVNDWARFDLYLENQNGGDVDSVLGLAFKSLWDPSGMANLALQSTDFSGCWFAPAGNHFAFTHMRPLEGNFAVARNNRTMVSGSGFVGSLHFLTGSLLPNGMPFYFVPDFSEIQIIAADHSLRSVVALLDSILVTDTIVALPNQNRGQFSIYPNPAADRVTVLLPSGMKLLQLFNAQGKLIASLPVEGLREMEIELSGLSDGIYMLRTSGPNGSLTKKLVLRH